MIPKLIHYCWFGTQPLPEMAIKCIESWQKNCPDYEIVEWNEKNFDIHINRYVEEAYEQKKWAFVSDYARFWVLYHYGGVYFDTDVELLQPIDDIVEIGPFMGFELQSQTKEGVAVAPGLGMAAESGMPFFKEVLQYYDQSSFLLSNNNLNIKTVVTIVTELLQKRGLVLEQKIQTIDGITIYPSDFFCPMDYRSGIIEITDHTRSIHYYEATWWSPECLKYRRFEHLIVSIFGPSIGFIVSKPIGYIYRFFYRLKNDGLLQTFSHYFIDNR